MAARTVYRLRAFSHKRVWPRALSRRPYIGRVHRLITEDSFEKRAQTFLLLDTATHRPRVLRRPFRIIHASLAYHRAARASLAHRARIARASRTHRSRSSRTIFNETAQCLRDPHQSPGAPTRLQAGVDGPWGRATRKPSRRVEPQRDEAKVKSPLHLSAHTCLPGRWASVGRLDEGLAFRFVTFW